MWALSRGGKSPALSLGAFFLVPDLALLVDVFLFLFFLEDDALFPVAGPVACLDLSDEAPPLPEGLLVLLLRAPCC